MDNGVDFVFAPRPFVNHHGYYAQARMRQQQFDGSIGVPVRTQPKTIVDLPPDNFKLAGLSVQHVESYHLSAETQRIRQRSPDTRSRRDPSAARRHVHQPEASKSPPSSSFADKYEHSSAQSSLASSQDDRERAPLPPQWSSVKQKHTSPVQLRHGRRYLRNETYPLPCDIQEVHRQNLKTMLTCSVLGQPVCSPQALARPPVRVLEVGCGSAYWTLKCHQMYSAMGHDDILYTGLDVVALAPDLKKQGVNWTFVQHDIRRCPWPFEDETFDLIMCKDMSIAIPLGLPSQRIMEECIRLLAVGGTLEIWESDHTIRCLQPHRPATRADVSEQRTAEKTATFPMSPSTPFAATSNRYLRSANVWIEQALGERNLASSPCSRVAPMLLQETKHLADTSFRRIAVPLSAMDWDSERCTKHDHDRQGRSLKRDSKKKKNHLDAEQIALREAALLLVVQFIESLEPLLRKASGKNTEEWSYWWASMLGSLTTSSSSRTSLNGECLELGAWWATKVGDASDFAS